MTKIRANGEFHLGAKEHKKRFAILYADLCGSTELKQRIARSVGDFSEDGFRKAFHAGVKLQLLHNYIVKDNLIAQGGKIIKEMGDAVLGYFERTDAAIRAAVQIQNSFNIYNLLFPSRQLHTKIAITASDEHQLYKVGSHCSAFRGKHKKVEVQDFLGTAMDEVARIQELARADEILVSVKVRNLFPSTKQFKLLDSHDETRLKPLKGLGKVELFLVPFEPFPAVTQKPRVDSLESGGENSEELVAVFPVGKSKEILGDIGKQQFLRFAPSRIRELPKLSQHFMSDGLHEQRVFFDAIVIGQSLRLWTSHFHQQRNREEFKGRNIYFRGVILNLDASGNVDALKAFVPNLKEFKQQKVKINESRNDILAFQSIGDASEKEPPLIRFYQSNFTLPESTRGCFSLCPQKLLEQSPNFHRQFRLDYRIIADALFLEDASDAKARDVFLGITRNNANPTVEISMQELIFADGKGLTFLSTMDWRNACRFEAHASGGNNSLYIRARKQTERIIRHANEIQHPSNFSSPKS